jgi:hypothetical protein
MNTEPQPLVEACFRCGQPAERPAVGEGHVAGAWSARPPHPVGYLFTGFGSTTGISNVLDETPPPFQASNVKVIFAWPIPTSSGTRTGP